MVAWLVVAAAAALELARRQKKQVPLAVADEVACQIAFFTEEADR